MRTAILITALIFTGFQATAEEEAKSQGNKKKVFVSFEEDLVQGSMTGAELFLILQKKQTKFDSLLELKDNFTPEMTQDAQNIK